MATIEDLEARIEKLEQTVQFLMEQLDLEDNASGFRSMQKPNAGVHPDVIRYIQEGKKIQAIKVYREQAGVGLKEAKDMIDQLEKQYRP